VSAAASSFWSAVAEQEGAQRSISLVVGLAVSVAATVLYVPASVIFGNFVPELAGVAVAGVAWFAFHFAVRGHARLNAIAEPLGRVFVCSVPALIVWALVREHGATVGFGAWLSAQVAAVIIAVSGLHLRPSSPLISALFCSAGYLAMYVSMRDELPPPTGGVDLWAPRLQLLRVGMLLAWGAVCGGLIWGLRRTLTRAVSQVRARDLFGKYRLGEAIASGGMGTVCRASYCPEGGFAREVAVKRIHPHLADRPSVVTAFRREAELGSRLHHPNIVATLDFGRVEQTYFVAMEYVDGASLRSLVKTTLLRRQQTREEIVAWLGRELCSGLHFAHDVATCAAGEPLRVIHDDICPDNILISRAGVPKLADFGVARALRDEAQHLTRHVVGKVGYFAPEQLRGEPFDGRADLFALAVVLWETLAGRRLFARRDVASAALAIVSGDVPDITTIRPDIVEGWRGFFARALAQRPDERFASAAAMAQALAEVVPAPVALEEVRAWLRPLLEETPDTLPMPAADFSGPTVSGVGSRSPGTTTATTVEDHPLDAALGLALRSAA
jgi:serine/threonine-protein kinase